MYTTRQLFKLSKSNIKRRRKRAEVCKRSSLKNCRRIKHNYAKEKREKLYISSRVFTISCVLKRLFNSHHRYLEEGCSRVIKQHSTTREVTLNFKRPCRMYKTASFLARTKSIYLSRPRDKLRYFFS